MLGSWVQIPVKSPHPIQYQSLMSYHHHTPNVIHIKQPHITSLACLIKLQREYKEIELKQWMMFKRRFLSKFKILTCAYCGRSNLKRKGSQNLNGYKLGHLATIDHVIPISRGGNKFDESNCVIACAKCNQRKGNSIKLH